MAGNNLIGSLRVSLGLDSAEFDAGLKRAQSGLAGFGKTVGVGLAAVAAAAAAATTGLAVAVKGAIDHADALSKASQKAGVTTESLSRLAYAASYSDVSLDGLTGGLQKLSKSLADAAGNSKSTAATAFRALGISVTDASGKLRNSDDVLKDVADRFSRLEDGSTKTALAMQLFGKSGAEMIPFLNGGAQDMQRLADEADRLGITLSTKTGKQAEHFNDTIAIVGNVLQGVVNKIMEAALPALDEFAQVLASPKFAQAAQALATGVVAALSTIAQVLAGLINGFVDLGNKIGAAFSYATGDPMQRTTAQLKQDIADYKKMLTGDKWVVDRPGTTRKLSEAEYELSLRGTVGGMGRAIAGGASGLAPAKAPPATDLPGFNLPAGIFNTGGDAAADKAKKAYDRVIASANDRIAQSKIEVDSLGKSALEADKLRFAQELLADATRDGNKLLPDQILQLNGLADTMAVAADKTRQLTDIYDTGRNIMGSFFSDLKSDLMGGTSLWGSFADAASKALGTIADKALGMAADGIWDMIFGALKGSLTGGNFIGGSIGAPALQLGFQKGIPGFANGGSGLIPGSGPTDSKLFMARVTPGEAFAFGDDAVRGMGGGGTSLNVTINAPNAGPGVVDQLEQWARLKLPAHVRRINNDPYAVG